MHVCQVFLEQGGDGLATEIVFDYLQNRVV